MSGQTIFENPVVVVSDLSTCQVDQAHRHSPRLHKAFSNLLSREEVHSLARLVVPSPTAVLVDYHLRPYSEEKIGFLASHLCLVLDIKKSKYSAATEKHSLFVKTVPLDVPDQAAYIEEKGCFRKEADFFRLLAPLMTDGWNIESWSPRCFMVKENTLVFEDMNRRGFANKSRFFDLKTMKTAIACIARYHAGSLLAEERLGKSLYELYSDVLQESEFIRSGKSYSWYKTAMDLAIFLADQLGLDSSKILSASERVFDMAVPSRTKRNVVSHGDLWSSNMLFDGEGRCNLIDFQLIRYAPLAHDVVQLMYLAFTRELREKHEKEILEYYYNTLREVLNSNGASAVVPEFKELLQGVEEQRYPAAVTAMIFHPTTLMDGKTAARIMNDPVSYATYYFKDRKSFVKDIMAWDKQYAQKLMEDARELAEMSLIVDNFPPMT